jgi:hypothetical protein
MTFEFSRQIFENFSNIKFYQNPSSGNRVPCGQTDMTKLIVAFRNCDAPARNELPIFQWFGLYPGHYAD